MARIGLANASCIWQKEFFDAGVPSELTDGVYCMVTERLLRVSAIKEDIKTISRKMTREEKRE
jgi:hypothetical protein